MATAPMKLGWRKLLPGYVRSPPPSPEKNSSGSASRRRFALSELSDGELSRNIDEVEDALTSTMMAGRYDRAANLRPVLFLLIEERDRRTNDSIGESDQLKMMYHGTSWRKKQKTDGCIHGDQISSKRKDMPSREIPFQFSVDNDRIESSSLRCTSVEHCNRTSLSRRIYVPRQTFCRRVVRNVSNLLAANSEKVKKVLLDDDVQCLDSLAEDASEKWEEVKIYYPARNDPECIELSFSDIKCLDSETFISSTIINFYIQYLQRFSLGRPRGDFYIFNTYFFEKLKDDKLSSFMKLRRWLKGENIFKKSYILLPIHGSQHWSLVIICNPAKGDEFGPILLHLDSLDIHPSRHIFQILVRYLTDEWKYMNQTGPPSNLPFNERIWKCLPNWIEEKKIMVPQQKNHYDCGIFVLYYMERFLKQAPERLGSVDFFLRRRREELGMFGKNWFKPEDASNLRWRIRSLLMEEFQDARLVENGEESESPGPPETPDTELCNLIDVD